MRWDVLLRSTTSNMFLNTFSFRCFCWKSLHYASYPTVCKASHQQSFAIFSRSPFNIFRVSHTPFFGWEYRCRLPTQPFLWIMGSSIFLVEWARFYTYLNTFDIHSTYNLLRLLKIHRKNSYSRSELRLHLEWTKNY